MEIRRIATIKSAEDFRTALAHVGVALPFDDVVESGPNSPLGSTFHWHGGVIGNRFAILPMEGWDGTSDGRPTDLTRRRWQRFGESGAKLIWGGEAVAVRHDGRANPDQLLINEANLADLADLRKCLFDAHKTRFDTTDDLYVGLQLTHSGRYARPNDKKRLEPRTLYQHPILDRRFGPDEIPQVLSDDDIARIVKDFVHAAKLAHKIGFSFVDIKHCHGYLGHEFLSSFDRPGKYGGTIEGRTRFLREIVEGIHAEAPGLEIGTRLSAIDFIPFRKGPDGRGVPESFDGRDYPYAFGANSATGLEIDLTGPSEFLRVVESLGIRWICTSAGSPYYNPHLLRPAAFPPSDGYLPPEDPLVGVARQIDVTRWLKQHHPSLFFVGSGYTYLQEWLPNVGQHMIRTGAVDFVGLGRMVLSYPELPSDVLAGKSLSRKKLCRTFSDCTTGPRNGMISGCFPLDPFYKTRPEREVVAAIRRHEEVEEA
jgi:2,4-dienoyl-CoA reductase-like NADH-dependent reductase (Old Yellow Enzyme family)